MSIEGAMGTIDELRRQRDAAIKRAEQAETAMKEATDAGEAGIVCAACDGSGRLPDGALMRAKRLDTGLTLRECAQIMGISPAYLSGLELNRRRWNADISERFHKATTLKPLARGVAYDAGEQIREVQQCHAGRDGDCIWTECPQKIEYQKSCPLLVSDDEE